MADTVETRIPKSFIPNEYGDVYNDTIEQQNIVSVVDQLQKEIGYTEDYTDVRIEPVFKSKYGYTDNFEQNAYKGQYVTIKEMILSAASTPEPEEPTTISEIVVVLGGGDGVTPVSSITENDVLQANIKLSDDTWVYSYPLNSAYSYKWSYNGSDDEAAYGTDSSLTVTSDMVGKTIVLTVNHSEYGEKSWSAPGVVA